VRRRIRVGLFDSFRFLPSSFLIPPSVSRRRDFEKRESRVAVCRAACFDVVFKAIPGFTRSRRSMSLTEVRRPDELKCKIGRRTTQQRELIQYQDL